MGANDGRCRDAEKRAGGRMDVGGRGGVLGSQRGLDGWGGERRVGKEGGGGKKGKGGKIDPRMFGIFGPPRHATHSYRRHIRRWWKFCLAKLLGACVRVGIPIIQLVFGSAGPRGVVDAVDEPLPLGSLVGHVAECVGVLSIIRVKTPLHFLPALRKPSQQPVLVSKRQRAE